MVLEIIIIKFSCILKMMSRNTFPEPQPDSASYVGALFNAFSKCLSICFHYLYIKIFTKGFSWSLPPCEFSKCLKNADSLRIFTRPGP